jgi:hypothetical protein
MAIPPSAQSVPNEKKFLCSLVNGCKAAVKNFLAKLQPRQFSELSCAFVKKYDTPFREFYAAATGKRVSGSHA